MSMLVYTLAVILLPGALGHEETVSHVDESQFSIAPETRYILYEVNPGEGFNLRRDVYMRVANLIRQLDDKNVVLVLPPWGGIYHWQSSDIGEQLLIPWSTFFDLDSMNRFIPVIEFETFAEQVGDSSGRIDLIYYLQRYAEGWTNGEWNEKWDVRPCIEIDRYYQKEADGWHGWFWGLSDALIASNLECISIQGQSRTLIDVLNRKESKHLQSVMIERAESVLHDHFGDQYYWQARRSMRYAKALTEIADTFRREHLNSNDVEDGTVLDSDWTKVKKTAGAATGGPYLAVHWRRKDFVRAHGKELPSINGTATQLAALLDVWQLSVVFLATDATAAEVDELKAHLPDSVTLARYEPSQDVKSLYKDGGVSVIDQWICAHARYFTGSHSSTFSYRIQEDREILGFDPKTTFNRLCPDHQNDCEQPAKWTIVYE